MEPKDKEPKREYDDCFTPEETQQLLVHLLRSPAVAAAASNQLNESHFADEGPHYRLVWGVAQGLIRKHGAEIVASSQFLDRLADKIRAILSGEVVLSDRITDDQIQAIDDLIKEVEKRSTETIDPDYGIELLKRFLIQRELQVEVHQLAELLKTGPLLSLPDSLQELAEMGARIQSLSIVTHDPIESEWDAHEERLARFRGRELVGLEDGHQVAGRTDARTTRVWRTGSWGRRRQDGVGAEHRHRRLPAPCRQRRGGRVREPGNAPPRTVQPRQMQSGGHGVEHPGARLQGPAAWQAGISAPWTQPSCSRPGNACRTSRSVPG